MIGTIKVIVEPTVEPVSLTEAQAWIRDDEASANETVVRMLIKAMREYAEHLTGRAFGQRTLCLYLDHLPVEIELPHPPLISVTSVQYTDEDEVLQTLSAAQYQVDAVREPGRIVPAWSATTWPSSLAIPNSVRITYVAGNLDGGSPTVEAPAKLKLWMQQRLATLFENREQLIVGTVVNPLPRDFVDGLLDDLVIAQRLLG